MKLLFFYNDETHAAPLLRAVRQLQALECELEAIHCPGEDRVCRNLHKACDAILIHEPIMCDEVLNVGVPVVILERIDGAQLGASRRWVDRVAAVVKGYVLRPPALNNEIRGRYHAHLLRDAGISVEQSMALQGQPQPQVLDLFKIYAGYGFGTYGRLTTCVHTVVDLDVPRKYDAHFVGIVDYSGSEIETHRRLALQVVRDWGGKPRPVKWGAGRPLPRDKYLLTMLRSRTVLSPWGWGEACHRDYEALLLGAVLIKPPMRHVVCSPNIYCPGKTCVECKPDLSDAAEQIAHVAAHWDDYREMRECGRNLALQAWRPEHIARRITDILEKCHGHCQAGTAAS